MVKINLIFCHKEESFMTEEAFYNIYFFIIFWMISFPSVVIFTI